MGRPSHEWEHEHDEETVSRETASAPLAQEAPVSSLAWASAIGNQAVQRLARRTLAREAVEEKEEEAEEGASAPEAAEGAEGAEGAAAAAPEDIAPEEAEGAAALDELPEDELPE
jgi:hypothetical protein